jgi:hypothetical protein
VSYPSSENNLRRELNLPRGSNSDEVANGRGAHTKVKAVGRGTGAGEVGVVDEVEQFAAELPAHVTGDLGRLQDAEVGLDKAWATAIVTRAGTVVGGGRREGRWVELIVRQAVVAGAPRHIEVAIRTQRSDECVVFRVSEVDRRPGASLHNGRELPAGSEPLRHLRDTRQAVHKAGGEGATYVDVSRGVVCFDVARVLVGLKKSHEVIEFMSPVIVRSNAQPVGVGADGGVEGVIRRLGKLAGEVDAAEGVANVVLTPTGTEPASRQLIQSGNRPGGEQHAAQLKQQQKQKPYE